MEVLGALTAPPLLQIAYSYLTIAWQQYGVVQGHKEQCSLILNRCQDLLVEVCRVAQRDDFTPEMQSNIVVLDNACQSVKDTICHVAGKGFAWRLLNQDKVVQAIAIAENTISDAFACFNFGAHLSAQRLQVDIEEARQKDHLSLVSQLEGLAENDQKILSALQADQRGRHRLEELVIALTKHVRNLSPAETNSDPTNKFLRTASATLQRLSNNPSPEIPHWSVTSLEVNFDPDEEATCIGRGGFGNIYKGEWNGLVVAVKEMYSEDARMLDRSNMKAILHEIKIWSRLTHPHVLPFYCACLEANKPFMVSRYCPNGNALEFLRKYPEYQRIPMLHEISLGMVYLHSQSVIHSDLKASNILIGDDGKALIADFGLSFLQEQASTGATRTMASSSQRLNGTLRWMAPELIDGEKLDKPADVYSYALLLWELYTGQVPYGNIPDRAFARRVVDKQERPSRPSNFDNDTLWLLTQSCWSPEPSSRPVFPVIQAKLRQLKGAIRGNDGHSLPTSPMSAYSAGSSISQMTAVNSPSSLDSTLPSLSGTTVSNTSLESPKAKSEGTPNVKVFDPPTQTLDAPSSATSTLGIPYPPDTPTTHSPRLSEPSEISSEPHASQPPTPSPRSPGYRALKADVVSRSGLLRERSPAPSSSLPEPPYPSSKVQKKNKSNASDSGTSTPLTSPPEVVEEKADHDGSQPRADILKTLNDIYSTKSLLPDLQSFPTLAQLVASERASLVPAFKIDRSDSPPPPVPSLPPQRPPLWERTKPPPLPPSRKKSPSPRPLLENEKLASRRVSDPIIVPSTSSSKRLSTEGVVVSPSEESLRRRGRPSPISPPSPTAPLSIAKRSPMSLMHKRFGSLVKDALPKASRYDEKPDPLEYAGHVVSLVPNLTEKGSITQRIRRLQYYLMPPPPPGGTICFTSIAMSQDRALVGTSNGSILFFDMNTGRLKGNLVSEGPCKDILLQILPNPEYQASAMRKLDNATLRTIGDSNPKEVGISSGSDGSLRLWNLESGKMIHEVCGHSAPVLCMVKHLHYIITGSEDEKILVWDICWPFRPSGPSHVLDRHTRAVTCLSRVQAGRFASGSLDSTIRLWRIDTNQHQSLVWTYRGHEAGVSHVVYYGTRIASVGLDSTIRIWGSETHESIAILPLSSPVTCLSNTRGLLSFGCEDGGINSCSMYGSNFGSGANACESPVRSIEAAGDRLIVAGDSGPVVAYTNNGKFEANVGDIDESSITIPSTPTTSACTQGSSSTKWRFAHDTGRWVFLRQHGSRYILDVWAEIDGEGATKEFGRSSATP